MDTQRIIADLTQERDRITVAINALEGTSQPTKCRAPGRRHMSADARARISSAMKLRWAQRKKNNLRHFAKKVA
jgi:hypothetical protein